MFSAHLMLAALCKVEELKLDETEAKRLGEAVAKVNAEFGGIVISPKTAAVMELVMAGCTIYGPRAVAYSVRIKKEQMKKTIEGQGTVHPPAQQPPTSASAAASKAAMWPN
jgi:hypothetical protein